MKVLKKIASLFGYSITRKHKTEDLNQLIELRLKDNPCDCLLDVGANIGNFLDEYSSLFKNSYAFEPNNEEHIYIKSMHYAQAEIDFVYEAVEMGVTVNREMN